MPIEVTAPTGDVITFPDETSEDVIHGVMTHHFGTPSARIVDEFSQLPRTQQPWSLTQPHEVPPPLAGQSFAELSRNVMQRARNTAFGQGPGSYQGIPGVALPAVLPGAAADLAAYGMPVLKTAGVIGGLGAGAYELAKEEHPLEALKDLPKDLLLALTFRLLGHK